MACALCVVLTSEGAAYAQPADDAFTKSAARSLAQEGDALYEKGDYAAALDRFERARSLIGAPTLDVRRARTLVKLGRLLLAEEQYVQVATSRLPDGAPDAFARAVEEARVELEVLKARIPGLVIERGEGVGPVELDGKPVAEALLGVRVPVDPGDHHLEASGAAPLTVRVKEGETQVVRLEVAPASPPPPEGASSWSTGRAQRVGAIVAFGVGAVGLGLGVGFGAAAIAKKGDLDEVCDANTGDCPLSTQGDIDTYETVGALSTVGFIVAGVGAATGAVLLLTAPSDGAEVSAAVHLVASPFGGALVGSF